MDLSPRPCRPVIIVWHEWAGSPSALETRLDEGDLDFTVRTAYAFRVFAHVFDVRNDVRCTQSRRISVGAGIIVDKLAR